jgi:hypothetical protein
MHQVEDSMDNRANTGSKSNPAADLFLRQNFSSRSNSVSKGDRRSDDEFDMFNIGHRSNSGPKSDPSDFGRDDVFGFSGGSSREPAFSFLKRSVREPATQDDPFFFN